MNFNQSPEPLDAPAAAIDEQERTGHRRGDERNRRGRQPEQIVCDVHRGRRFNGEREATDGPVATRSLPQHLVSPAHRRIDRRPSYAQSGPVARLLAHYLGFAFEIAPFFPI
ncbi:hypothetical protein [Mycobacterium sp. JS623]|uniref:hypothetical protein n=1 Tax=Mycobacterium sp. JS623 TaxID=212767 RepID=UPI0012F996B5|nr:hypothetical protein [Mycobacterium sp. JS623]